MNVCSALAKESCIPSSLKERYTNGRVRKALAMASQPAIFIALEVKYSPAAKTGISIYRLLPGSRQAQPSLTQFRPVMPNFVPLYLSASVIASERKKPRLFAGALLANVLPGAYLFAACLAIPISPIVLTP